MKKILYVAILWLIGPLFIHLSAQTCQTPVIDAFSPITGYIGSTVTISGSDFEPVAGDNQVFFGATQATVLTANAFSLTVKVPVGSTYAPITVRKSCGKVAQSKLPFNAIFCNAVLRDTSYNQVTYSQSVSGGYQMLSQDIDLDGKPDLLVTGFTTNAVSVVRNLSTPGNMSFASPVALSTSSNTRCTAPGDFDGDGKVDLAVTVNGYGIYIFKNTSTPGTISFASPITYSSGVLGTSGTYQMWAGDLNGDGKLDLVYSDFSGTVRTLLNTSTSSISFTSNTTINNSYGTTGISIGDIDGDGILDIVTSCPGNDIMSVIRNTTTIGSSTFSFASPVFFNTGSSYPYRAFVGDFDKDGKLELVANNHSGATVSIFRNTSTPGSVSMASPVNISSPTSNYRVAIGDADGDGLPDIVTKSSGENLFSVYKNVSGGVGSIAFNTRIDYPGTAEVSGISIGDLDGDYVPDIATSGISYNRLNIYRNKSASIDTTNPTALCRNIIIYLDSTGNASITANDVDNGSSDACGISSLALNKYTFNCADLGNNTVTLTVTDRSNNTSTCTANVEVKAIQPSGITTLCSGSSVVLSAVAGTSYLWSTSETTRSITVNSSGTYTVQVIGSAGCNDTITSSITVTVISTPTSFTVSGGGIYCSDGSAGPAISLSGSQTGIIYRLKRNGSYIMNVTGTGSALNFGNFTIPGVYKVDATVLSSECPNTVTMNDSAVIKVSTIPKVSLAQSATQICSGQSASVYTNRYDERTYYIALNQLVNVPNSCGTNSYYNGCSSNEPGFTWSDNGNGSVQSVKIEFSIGVECHFAASHSAKLNGNVFTNFNQTPQWCNCNGSSSSPLVTLVYNNPANYNVGGSNSFAIGNVNTCIGFYPSSSYNNHFAKVTVVYGSNTNGLSLLWSPGNETTDSIVVSPTVNTSYILAATDSVGCTGYDTATIQVNPLPTVSITLSGPPIVANNSTVTLTASANDSYLWNTSETTQSITVSTAGFYNVTVTNSFGCWATSQIVEILDCTYPVITCPSDITAYTDNNLCETNVTYQATATGLPSPAITYSVSPGSVFSAGTHTVYAYATNACGVDSCSFTITVIDMESPIFATIPDVTIYTNTNSCNATNVNLQLPGATDNCAVDTVYSNAPSVFNLGATNVTYTAVDIHNNNTTATNTITVVDNVAPVANCKNITVQLGSNGTAMITANDIDNGSYDNCGIQSITIDNNSFNCTNVGSNTVTLTVTDNNNNTSTCQATVMVEDNVAPTAICQNITVQLGANGTASITANQIDNGSNDACGIKTVSIDKSSFNCTNVGSNTVTLTVTDNNNNTSTCQATVTVQDNVAPTAICQNASVTLSDGTAVITASQIDNGSNDACGIKSLSLSKSTFSCADIGQNTVTLTVTDNNNNTSTCQATVTVNGVIPTCNLTVTPSNNTYTGGVATNIYLGYGPQSAVISCSASGGSGITYSWSGSYLSGSGSNVTFTPTTAGNFVITCTVTNSNGCSYTCSVTMCVKDINAGGSGKNQKVYLCHVPPGNPNNPQTLSIAISAVPSHLGQHSGDRLGGCTQTCATSKKVFDASEVVYSGNDLFVSIYPNPSNAQFNMEVITDVDDEIALTLVDVQGKVIVSMDGIAPRQIVQFGESMASGIYFARIKQGDNLQVIKVTKTN